MLVFGGPKIIERLLVGYSEGALMPSGVSVTPTLDVRISRLDFVLNEHDDEAGNSTKGFSRATEISWSLLGQKPFLEINFGPSVLEDRTTVESATIYTPSFQDIDWQKIALVSNIHGLNLNSFANLYSLTVKGNFNSELGILSNVFIEAEEFSVAVGNSNVTGQSIRSELQELDFNGLLLGQFFSATFEISDLIAFEPNFTAPLASFELILANEVRNLNVELHDVELPELGGFIKNVKLEGSFNQSDVLQQLQVDFIDGFLFHESSKFPEVTFRANKSLHEQYKASIEGSLAQLEIFSSGNYIGTLPANHFVVDVELFSETSMVTLESKINFDGLNSSVLNVSLRSRFDSKSSSIFECEVWECELSDLDLFYQIDLNEEWVRGNLICPKAVCVINDMDHWVRTSNTGNVFTILNGENILSPIASLYLYGAISSGQKINGGHQVKLQF